MSNITYHRFDENGRYTETIFAPEENINFEDPTKIYVGDVFNETSGELNAYSATSGIRIHLYYHDFNTNKPVLIPENTNPALYKKFDYVTKQWVADEPIVLTDEETAIATQFEWKKVRALRNQKIQSTDWTQLPDVPLSTKETWATYRQALRDVTSQTDPFNITWPTPPQ